MLNQSHHAASGGVVLFYGERLLIFYDGCDIKLGNPLNQKGSGRVYLTSHRVIFTNRSSSAGLQSFSMPFVLMSNVDIKQPVFGANRIVGEVSADVNSGWNGKAEFSLTFNRGGAIEFGRALIELGRRACAAKQYFAPPPPYSPQAVGAAQYYDCPPPAYAPPQADPYYNFVPQHESFGAPPAQTLYYVGCPPPYPGAVSQTGSAWGVAPPPTGPQQQIPPYPQTQVPQYNNMPGAGTNFNIPNQSNMSASHAAKAAEAAASAVTMNNVQPGYYFQDNPHTVYAHPSAPPPNMEPPPFPAGSSASGNQDPPPYSSGPASNNPYDKKNQ
ncbi:hypothetical protein T265_10376 [Opisthorchis viverrini]|uniref:GRAM domain-containing protein n=2 Tax=Opisthorchis viverrini TaxID=6198 RepID=A0A074Z6S1_OPIVI|nr:hypothetical protein T265_10376 [Opisthorchis viverrini]KER21247.1 hypothetical protein T265_10376 [Opisthorchis viverrini]